MPRNTSLWSWHNSFLISNSSCTRPWATQMFKWVVLRYWEIIINSNSFARIYFHILQKIVIFLPSSLHCEEEEFFTKMVLALLEAAFMSWGCRAVWSWPWPCKQYREIEDTAPALHIGRRDHEGSGNRDHQLACSKVNCQEPQSLLLPRLGLNSSFQPWPLCVLSSELRFSYSAEIKNDNNPFTMSLGLNERLYVKHLANRMHGTNMVVDINS